MPIQYSEKNLSEILNSFDTNRQKQVLIVYVHSISNKNNINSYISKNVFQNSFIENFINANFQFYPTLQSFQHPPRIVSFFNATDVPCFLFLRYDIENRITLLRKINLADARNPDQLINNMMNIITENTNITTMENNTLKKIQMKKTSKQNLEKTHNSKIQNLLNNPSGGYSENTFDQHPQ